MSPVNFVVEVMNTTVVDDVKLPVVVEEVDEVGDGEVDAVDVEVDRPVDVEVEPLVRSVAVVVAVGVVWSIMFAGKKQSKKTKRKYGMRFKLPLLSPSFILPSSLHSPLLHSPPSSHAHTKYLYGNTHKIDAKRSRVVS
jgi:hypothetical protein